MFLLVLIITSNFMTASLYDSFELSEEKLSEICSYVADDCEKCVQYKSCFWCPSHSVNERSTSGSCMANYNTLSRYKCMSRHIYSFETEQCPTEYNGEFNTKTGEELQLLVNLLKLLKHLHKIRVNSTKSIINGTILSSPIQNMTNSQPSVNSRINISANISTTNITSQMDFSNKTIHNLTVHSTHQPTKIFVNTTKTVNTGVTSTILKKLCKTENFQVCFSLPGCTWQVNTCVVSQQLTSTMQVLVHPHCVTKRTCGSCTESSSCYWCDRSKTCHSFTSAHLIPKQCKDSWYHDECSYKKSVFLIIIPTISIIIFLSIAYVCLKNCYYHQLRPVEVKLEERPILFKEKNGKTVYQITESEDEEDDRRIIAEKSDLFW